MARHDRFLDIEIVVPPEVSDAAVDDAIAKAIERTGILAFQLSQDHVPVRTGALKASGSLEIYEDGFALVYEMPYAEVMDKGRPRSPIIGNQVIEVEESERELDNGVKVHIPAHIKVYVNSRVVPIQTEGGLIFRVIHEWPAIKGTGYITDSISEAWTYFDDYLDEEIQNILPPEYGVERD